VIPRRVKTFGGTVHTSYEESTKEDARIFQRTCFWPIDRSDDTHLAMLTDLPVVEILSCLRVLLVSYVPCEGLCVLEPQIR